jgi:hypothetical protein
VTAALLADCVEYRPTCAGPGGCSEPVYALKVCLLHYGRVRRLQRANGAADKVPVNEVRAHVQLLRWRGWPWHPIAAAGRTSTGLLHRIMSGEVETLRRDKAARIVAVEPVWKPTQLAVPAHGTRRRLDALAWQGWANVVVARELGLSEWTFPNSRRSMRLTAAVAAAVAGFYDEHAHRAGPNPVFAKKARTMGCLPASVWDEDGSIDNPRQRPQGRAS